MLQVTFASLACKFSRQAGPRADSRVSNRPTLDNSRYISDNASTFTLIVTPRGGRYPRKNSRSSGT